MDIGLMPERVATSAQILQTALTPVFLLAGTAGFLSVINTRLSRVADRVNEVGDLVRSQSTVDGARQAQLSYLRFRTVALEIAVIAGVTAGLLTCLAVLSLLAGAIGRPRFETTILVWLFAGAVFSLGVALLASLVEMVAAVHSMLRQMAGDLRSRSGPGTKAGSDPVDSSAVPPG